MTTAGEMDEARCPMAERGTAHAPHGFMGAKITNSTSPPKPVFLQCLGFDPGPDGGATAPERAGREGESQPLPVGTDELDTQSVAMALIDLRRQVGIRRYGQPLQPSNGRDSLWDAVEEALDLYLYLVNAWRATNPSKPVPGLEN